MERYKQLQEKYIDELKTTVTIYEHLQSGAKVCTMINDDNNKVFSITFKTPPLDNTGIPHILEHSVLCGSKNYPVKDPFVELLKGSVNTYLNAMTFADKTMYPVASQNTQDFKNLMAVYLDAVFYPRIYEQKEIFMQEGWHYNLRSEQDDLTINGVVYNEMKGAYSDPEDLLFHEIMHSLYPETSYRYESGGNPDYIPRLSYEKFLNFHRKHYHPSNAYLILYGNCDMEERLAWLDKNYLSKFKKQRRNIKLIKQAPFLEPVYRQKYYQLEKEKACVNQTYLSYNISLPNPNEQKYLLALNLILIALFITPGAPIKEALIKKDLASDIITTFDDSLLQPVISIVALNSNYEKEKEFITTIDEMLKEVVEKGIDKKAITAIINYQEFKVREGKFGSTPRGLELMFDCLSSWLYADDLPFEKLETLTWYAELRKEIGTGYFEDLINEYFLKNTHKSYVALLPSHKMGDLKRRRLKNKLARFKNSLTTEELKQLVISNQKLLDYQKCSSTPTELATIPKLKLEDLTIEPEKLNCEEILGRQYQVLFSDYFTNNIAYVTYSFNLTNAPIEFLQYVRLVADLLTNLSTEKYHYKDIHQFIQNNTGGLAFFLSSSKKINNESYTEFKITFSTLSNKINLVNELIEEIINNTLFDDLKRIQEKLVETSTNLESVIVNNGQLFGINRAQSYYDIVGYINDKISGIGYLDFINNILNNLPTINLVNELKNTLKKIFSQETFSLRVTCAKDDLNISLENSDAFYQKLPTGIEKFIPNYQLEKLNEAFSTEARVNNVCLTGRYEEEFTGAILLANNALSLDYLWQKIRVNGGAYGATLMTPITKNISICSYRDPNITQTLKVFTEISTYLAAFNPSDEEFLQYKIGTIGGLDRVLHVSSKGLRAQTNYLQGYTYELQLKYRKEVISATREDIRALAKIFSEVVAKKNICVIGSGTEIKKHKNLFGLIRVIKK